MARTKGSKNKKVEKVKVLKPLSNFKSMEVTEIKTRVIQIGFTNEDVRNLIIEKAKELSNLSGVSGFGNIEIVYDKKKNAFITLTNPVFIKEVVNKLHESLAKNSAS